MAIPFLFASSASFALGWPSSNDGDASHLQRIAMYAVVIGLLLLIYYKDKWRGGKKK